MKCGHRMMWCTACLTHIKYKEIIIIVGINNACDNDLYQPTSSKNTTEATQRWDVIMQVKYFVWNDISMGKCKKDVTSLLMHWSYIFLALTYWYVLLNNWHSITCENHQHIQTMKFYVTCALQAKLLKLPLGTQIHQKHIQHNDYIYEHLNKIYWHNVLKCNTY